MNTEQTKTTDQLPFGLRYAADSRSGTTAHTDWSAIGYDPCRQVATWTEDGVTMPLIMSDSASAQRSTSKSTSSSSSDGTTDTDSETDY